METFQVAIVAAVLASGLTFAIQTFFILRSEDVAAINDHIEETRRIEELALEYWLTVPTTGEDERARLAALLSGVLSASAHFNELAERVLGAKYARYKDLDDRIFEVTTGGNFPGAVSSEDLSRVVQIMNLCNEMRALLRACRRSLYWTH